MTTSILDTYFTPTTMSVHFQKGQKLLSKQGKPGGWTLVTGKKVRTKKMIHDLVETLHTEIATGENAFIEIQRSASQVLQIGPYRVVIVEEPVANSIEITVVRPVAKLQLHEYKLPDSMVQRLVHDAQGILIAGSPGEGKTTFAQALIEEIAKKEVIIKTIESPRDLVVPASITQYSSSHAPHDELRDILLLSRPDYSVYDEVRNNADFHLYKDLRLTGIGLIGVMHATQAVDSIQRFIAAVDMGTVSQVIDTVVFIRAGQVEEILSLEQVVGTPTGMNSDDLARPLIMVHSLLQDKALYEIYSYGDNVVVMPLDKVHSKTQEKTALQRYAEKAIAIHLQELVSYRCHVEVNGPNSITMYVPEGIKGRIIGKQGKRIEEIQKITGLSISVRTPDALNTAKHTENISYSVNEIHKAKKTIIEIQLPKEYKHEDIQIMIGGQLMQFTANHEAIVVIRRKKLIANIQDGDIHVLG